MGNTISESLNKGVPVWAPVNIRQIDLITNSENPEIVREVIHKNFEKYMAFLRNIGTNADISFFSTLMVVVDEETLEKKLIFSPAGFISSLSYNLNYNNICRNINQSQQEHLTLSAESMIEPYYRALKERIQILKNIKTHKKFQREFPFIYDKFESQRERTQKLKDLLKKLEQLSAVDRQKYISNFEQEQRKLIPNFSFEQYVNENLNVTVETFVAKYATVFNNLLENANKIIEYLFSSYIDISELGTDNQEKLELFFASQYLLEAEMMSSDMKQDFLYYVSNYFASHPNILDSDIFITLGTVPKTIPNYEQMSNKNGYIVTPQDIYERYRQILIDNPNLRAIDFSHLDFTGLTASEVKGFMDEYLKDLSAHWDILDASDQSYEEETLIKIKSSGKEMNEEDRAKHQQRLLELFMEKKRLYDSSDPFYRIKGKDTFEGYIGYIYKNGRVVLDKFYEDVDSKKIADGHAVYAMSILEFYEVSKLSKSEIIRRRLCNRYIHTGSWAQRVLENEINAESNENPVAMIKKLIKKGSITDPS